MKRFLNLLTCLLLVFTLTGCKDKEKDVKTNDKEEQEEIETTVVSCTTNKKFWDDTFEEVDDATVIISAEYNKSGKMVKMYMTHEIKLKTSDKDIVEEYRKEADELCTDPSASDYEVCNTTVDGNKITSKAEYKSSYLEESKDLPTQQEFIEILEEDDYMTCTIE